MIFQQVTRTIRIEKILHIQIIQFDYSFITAYIIEFAREILKGKLFDFTKNCALHIIIPCVFGVSNKRIPNKLKRSTSIIRIQYFVKMLIKYIHKRELRISYLQVYIR